MLGIVSEYGSMLALYRRLYETAKSCGNLELVVQSQLGLCLASLRLADFEQARQLADGVCNVAQELADQDSLAFAHWLRGEADYDQGRYDSSRSQQLAALDGLRQSEDLHLKASCLNSLGNIEYRRQNLQSALDYLEQAQLLRLSIGDLQGLAATLNNKGNIARQMGEYEEAEKYLREALSINETTGNKLWSAHNLNNLNALEQDHGNLESARKYSLDSLKLRQEIGDRLGEASTRMNLANLEIAVGNLDAASPHYDAALRVAQEVGDQRLVMTTLYNLGELEKQLGNHEAARSYLGESLEMCRLTQEKKGEAMNLEALAWMEWQTGNRALALELQIRCFELRLELGEKHGILVSCLDAGRSMAEMGEVDTARRLLLATRANAEEMSICFKPGQQQTLETALAIVNGAGTELPAQERPGLFEELAAEALRGLKYLLKNT